VQESEPNPNDRPLRRTKRGHEVVPQGWRRWANVAAFVDDAVLRHPVSILWSALVVMFAMPVAMITCMFIGVGGGVDFVRDLPLVLVLGEPLLLAGLVAWDMRRPREGTRRFMLAVGLANAGFGMLFGALYGNVFMCPIAAAAGVAVTLMVAGKEPRRWGTLVGWALFALVSFVPCFLLWKGQATVAEGSTAWHARDFDTVREKLAQAWPMVNIKGGSDIERAVIAIRATEACQRTGEYEAAAMWAARAAMLAPYLTLPAESDREHPIEFSLPWRLAHQALPVLTVAAYAGRAWDEDFGWMLVDPVSSEYIRPDAMIGAKVSSHDRLGWARGLVGE